MEAGMDDYVRKPIRVSELEQALDAASDRVSIEYIGESVQGDPLMLVIATEPGQLDGLRGRGDRVRPGMRFEVA